ncbi:YIP1 family protein [Bacillus kexueae]|uniref:YIP1 family protein n=1 Tax=Aeribacillus kexueae TaxID=2078952 RepID=UPI001FAF9595|nr:YIP1 family protein [Bacillus kexueae]
MTETVERKEKPKLFGIITSPNETMDRIKENPKVLIPLLVVMAISILSAFIGINAVDVSSMAGADIPAEEAEMFELFTKISAVVFGIITPPIILLISTLIYLAITKIAGTGAKFKQLFSLSTYIGLITAIGTLLNTIIISIVGISSDSVSFTSLNAIVGAEGALSGFLSSIEVFAIWSTILSAIGLERVGGLSKRAAWIVTIILFAIGVLFSTFSAAASSMMGA